MWYKQEQNGTWLQAIEVRLNCQGELKILTEENKEEEHEGWFWSDEEPEEYVDWLTEEFFNEFPEYDTEENREGS